MKKMKIRCFEHGFEHEIRCFEHGFEHEFGIEFFILMPILSMKKYRIFFFFIIKMSSKDEYEYTYYYRRKDGSIGQIHQKIPKRKVRSRILIDKYREGNQYVYKYKTYFADGEVKVITMKKYYDPIKEEKN